MQDLSQWQGVSRPIRQKIEGRYVRLEPLAEHHAAALYEAVAGADKEARFRYLHGTLPPADSADMLDGAKTWKDSSERIYFAVVNKVTGLAEGYFSLMRMDCENGVVEIGAVLWGRPMARTRRATEAVYWQPPLFLSLATGALNGNAII